MMDGSLAINKCSIYNHGKDRLSHIHNHSNCCKHLFLVVHLHVNFDACSPVVPDRLN